MAKFKVGDRVIARTVDNRKCYTVGFKYTVAGYKDDTLLRLVETNEAGPAFFEHRFELAEPRRRPLMEEHKEAYRAAARSTDPATSKGKRKVNKYEQAVLTHLTMLKAYGGGATGKEIANAASQPLNCITPRFAPLRRKGLIKPLATGLVVGGVATQVVKRDKQIVWVLA